MDRNMRKILLLVVCLLMPAALVAQEDNDSTGYERDITLSTLQRICHALNVPMGILLFLGSSQDEFGNISKELEAELAKNTLFLLSEASNEKAG